MKKMIVKWGLILGLFFGAYATSAMAQFPIYVQPVQQVYVVPVYQPYVHYAPAPVVNYYYVRPAPVQYYGPVYSYPSHGHINVRIRWR